MLLKNYAYDFFTFSLFFFSHLNTETSTFRVGFQFQSKRSEIFLSVLKQQKIPKYQNTKIS